MAKRLIICAADGRTQANRIIGHLINGGFDEGSISMLFADKKGHRDPTEKKDGGLSMKTKAGVGALLGGAFVWLGGTGILSVPELGSLVIAGAPLVAMMGRLNSGGVGHALEVMGLPRDEAGAYEAKVKRGDILVSIRVSDDRDATAVRQIVRAIGVQNIVDPESVRSLAEARPGGGEMMLGCVTGWI